MRIRAECPDDGAALRTLALTSFETPAEADLIEALGREADSVISRVAEDDDGTPAGHVLFTPVRVEGAPERSVMALGPMSVEPMHRRQGVGSRLVREGLTACADAGADAVVVLGYPAFYQRFGFAPASEAGLVCEFDVPPAAFMVRALRPGGLDGVAGTVHYHRAFRSLC